MDPWKECAAWQESRDAVRHWADLEGKSPQMAEDLMRQNALQASREFNKPLLLVASLRAVVWAIQTWWQITRR